MTKKLKLWLLKPHNESEYPWEPWYDKAFGFIVRASSEQEARKMATKDSGTETRYVADAWLDNEYSTCVELIPDGSIGVIIRDFKAA